MWAVSPEEPYKPNMSSIFLIKEGTSTMVDSETIEYYCHPRSPTTLSPGLNLEPLE